MAFKLQLKNKGMKQHFLVGIVTAIVASALIPEQYNPVVMVNDLLAKFKKD